MYFGTLRTAQQRAQRGLAAEALGLAAQSGALRGGCFVGDVDGSSSSCRLSDSGGQHLGQYAGSGSWCGGSGCKNGVPAAAAVAMPAAEGREEWCSGGTPQSDASAAAPSPEGRDAPAKNCSSSSREQQQQANGSCYLPTRVRGDGSGRCSQGAAASPLSPLQPAIRSHIQLSSIGREQRAGVGAGACLQW